jgi:ABC-type Fe3+-siderophore transport system permease subunit
MALTFSSFFALGVALITFLKNKLDLDSFLCGDILGVTRLDIQRTAIIAGLILLVVKLFYKELLFYTFDKTGAQAIGLPINTIYVGFMAAITLTIIASMQAVGVILVISLLVGPALTAYLLVKELHQMMIVGAVVGAIARLSGVYLSYNGFAQQRIANDVFEQESFVVFGSSGEVELGDEFATAACQEGFVQGADGFVPGGAGVPDMVGFIVQNHDAAMAGHSVS